MYAKGDKVQALDELGRWEEARVVDTLPDGVAVAFVGWPGKYNRIIAGLDDEIRRIVDPFEEDFRSRHGKRVCGPQRTDVTRTLCRGDVVTIKENGLVGEGEVVVVDRYKRSVKIKVNGEKREVPATTISTGNESELAPEMPCSTRLHKRKSTTPRTVVEDAVSTAVGTSAQTDSNISAVGFTFSSYMNKFGDNIAIGRIVQLPFHIVGAVKTITSHPLSCTPPICADIYVFDNDHLDCEVTIRLPIDRLHLSPTTISLSRETRAMINNMQAVAKSESIQQLLNAGPMYRKMHRTNQLCTALRREVSLGLKIKSRYRRFCLGLSAIEYDEAIFNITVGRKIYNYKVGNIKDMDLLLGHKWDILPVGENITQYVTQLSLWITKDGFLSGSVRAAVCREHISPTNYREDLKQNITVAKEQDDTCMADESDEEV